MTTLRQLPGHQLIYTSFLTSSRRLIQVIGTVLLPPSFEYSVYQRAALDPELSNFTSHLEVLPLAGTYIDRFSPITLFAPDNLAWSDYDLTSEQVADLLDNHLFEGLLTLNMLREMNGQSIQSVNAKQFLVTVEGGTVTIRGIGTYSELTKATIRGADILGSTGILHRVSGVMTDTALPLATDAPTISPTTASPTVVPIASTTLPPTAMATIASTTSTPTASPTDTATINGPSLTDDATLVPEDESLAPSKTNTETLSPSMFDSMDTIAPTDDPSESNTTDSTMMVMETDGPSTNDMLPPDDLATDPPTASEMSPIVGNATEDAANITGPSMDGLLQDEEIEDDSMTTAPPSVAPSSLPDPTIPVDPMTASPTEQVLPTQPPITDAGNQIARGTSGGTLHYGNSVFSAVALSPSVFIILLSAWVFP